MAAGAPVLVVDDDPEIRGLVSEYLEGEGFRVAAAADGSEMRALLHREPPAVVLLDLILPGEDGLGLLRELKERHGVGVILLTVKGEVVDRVLGLEMGADDYLPKPFHLRELAARIRSVLRRREPAEPAPGETPDVLAFAGWSLDRSRRELRAHDGRPVELTSGEYELLSVFVEHPNRVLTRDQLLDLTRGRSYEPFDRAIDVQVGRLRRKIEADPRRPSLIKTVRGAGYILAAKVEPR